MFAVVVATLTAPNSSFPHGLMTSKLDMFRENCSMLAMMSGAQYLRSTFISVLHVDVSAGVELSSRGVASGGST